jgi:metal-responsive CopG/Arc/MetJ family transcriptional regulator
MPIKSNELLVKTSIDLEESLLKKIDDFIEKNRSDYRSRAQFFSKAAVMYINAMEMENK